MPAPAATCPHCARPIARGAPQGLCPACLAASLSDLLGEAAEQTAPQPPLAVPHERVGDYELLDELGRGGMGVVFRARDLRLNRIVALKLILTGQIASEAEVKRFLNEAEAAAQLEHPNIVPIYEVGESGGRHFFAMKLVEGGALSGRISNLKSQISNVEAAKLLAKTARAVHHAHQRGILHRDLKPGNILLDASGEPLVADFGLARRVDGASSLTLSGAALGSPNYMAPEQASGGARAVTTAADLYSLGAILYELLCGRPPFLAATPLETMRQVVEEEPVPPSRVRREVISNQRSVGQSGKRATLITDSPITDYSTTVDRDLETICLKCLAKEPARRYATAEALANDLERWLRHEPIFARPSQFWERALKWVRRHPARAGLVAAALLAPVAIITLLLFSNARIRHAREGTRLNLYAADMQNAQTAIEDANLHLARQLLDAHRPRGGEPDLRGFEWRHLWGRARSGQLRTLRAHAQPVHCVAFSADGQWLASAETGPVAWFWNTTTWRNERAIDWSGPMPVEFSWISFSPREHAVALTLSRDFSYIFDTRDLGSHKARGCIACRVPAEGGRPRTLWSPSGSRLAFLAHDALGAPCTAVVDWTALQAHRGPTRAWQTGDVAMVAGSTGDPRFLSYPEAPVRRFPAVDQLHSFTGDGRLLAQRGGLLVQLDLERGGEPVIIPSAHRFDYCEHSGAGGFLAGFNSGPKDRHSVLLDEFQPGFTNTWEMNGHTGDLRCLAVSPDGRTILTGSADHTARLWDPKTRQTVSVLNGHSDEVTAVAWSPDGKLIATGSRDRTVMLWSAATTNEFDQTAAPLVALFPPWVLSADGTALAAVRQAGTNQSAPLVVNFLGRNEPVEIRGEAALTPVLLSAEGRELLTVNASDQGQIELRRWSVASQTNLVMRVLDLPGTGASPSNVLWAVSADLAWIVRGDAGGQVHAWHLAGAHEPGLSLATGGPPVAALAFSPDGRTLALARTERDGSGRLSLWRAGDPASRVVPLRIPTGLNGVAWSPDGATLAAACEDYTVKLFDPRTRRLLKTLAGHKRGLAAVAWSPDGLTLASGDGRTIKLWHAQAGREMLTVHRDIKMADPLRWLAFPRDGTRLLAGDDGGRVQVFTAPGLGEADRQP